MLKVGTYWQNLCARALQDRTRLVNRNLFIGTRHVLLTESPGIGRDPQASPELWQEGKLPGTGSKAMAVHCTGMALHGMATAWPWQRKALAWQPPAWPLYGHHNAWHWHGPIWHGLLVLRPGL